MKYLTFSKNPALGSFLIGTILLISLYLLKIYSITILGLLYISLAVIVNGSFLFILIYDWIFKKEFRKEIIKSILILLLNIPIVFIYLKIAFWIIGNMSNE